MTTVLVAGGTGMLGSRIAERLLDRDGVAVRLLLRDGWERDADKRARIAPLVARGATVALGDVLRPDTLGAATADVDVVVSALQGRNDVIVGGQIALAEAAVHGGVRRFIPSDFAIDLFRAPSGAPQFEARKQADAAIEALDLEVLHILNGGFMDQLLDPAYPGMIDVEHGVVRHWGTGDEEFDLTTVADTAAFAARVATDATARSGVHAISGARVSFNGIARALEGVVGVTLRPMVLGDAAALRQAIAAKGGSWDAAMEWYALAMLTTPPLEHPANDRYPDVRPVGLQEYLAGAYAPRR